MTLAFLSLPAWSAPSATVMLDTELSTCESGRLLMETSGTSGGRQYWRATATDSVNHEISVLGENEEQGPSGDYSGPLDLPFLTGPVPYGIAVTLYGYVGSTPPTPATTAEFSITYICDTLEVVATSAGAYGAITILPIRADVPMLARDLLCVLALALAALGAAMLQKR